MFTSSVTAWSRTRRRQYTCSGGRATLWRAVCMPNRVARTTTQHAATSSAAHRTVVCRHRWRAYALPSKHPRGPRPSRRRCPQLSFAASRYPRPPLFAVVRVSGPAALPVPAAADRAHVICPVRVIAVIVIGIIERGGMMAIGGDDDSSRSVEPETRDARDTRQ